MARAVGVTLTIDDFQRVSDRTPLLADFKPSGLYVMEDLHTSYWPSHEGGHMRRGTAIEFIKRMIDDLHGWYHTRPTATFAKTDVGAIHIYDSLVVIEKQRKPRLGHIKAGRTA